MLSRPSAADIAFLRELEGDLLILGVAGKMGPSLAQRARRAASRSRSRRSASSAWRAFRTRR